MSSPAKKNCEEKSFLPKFWKQTTWFHIKGNIVRCAPVAQGCTKYSPWAVSSPPISGIQTGGAVGSFSSSFCWCLSPCLLSTAGKTLSKLHAGLGGSGFCWNCGGCLMEAALAAQLAPYGRPWVSCIRTQVCPLRLDQWHPTCLQLASPGKYQGCSWRGHPKFPEPELEMSSSFSLLSEFVSL